MDFMDLIEIPRVDNVKLYRQIFSDTKNQLVTQKLEGSLCLTSHHLIFSNKSIANQANQIEIWVNK